MEVGSRVLLDTNAYSDLRRGAPDVANAVRQASEIVFSPVVAGELFYGFRRSSRCNENVRDLQEFLRSPHVTLLPVTLTTADRFGRVVESLRLRGRPIPTNDAWIAAQALEHGATVLSRDSHFGLVEGVVWMDPSDS